MAAVTIAFIAAASPDLDQPKLFGDDWLTGMDESSRRIEWYHGDRRPRSKRDCPRNAAGLCSRTFSYRLRRSPVLSPWRGAAAFTIAAAPSDRDWLGSGPDAR